MECLRCAALMDRFVERADGSGSDHQEGWRCLGCGIITRPIITATWTWWRTQVARQQRLRGVRRSVSNRVLHAIERFSKRSLERRHLTTSSASRERSREKVALRLVPNRRRDALRIPYRLKVMDRASATARYRLGIPSLRLVRKRSERFG